MCGRIISYTRGQEPAKPYKSADCSLTKFSAKPVQILKSDRFCDIIETELLYTFLNADLPQTGQLPRLMAVGM